MRCLFLPFAKGRSKPRHLPEGMRRQGIYILGLVWLVLAGIVVSTSAGAEKPVRVIGVLSHASVTDASLRGFQDEMIRNGWREGETLFYRYAGPRADEASLQEEAERLVASKVDLLLALSTRATLAAIKAAEKRKIPVLFAPVRDPVSAGLARSLRFPGGIATGVTFSNQEARRLEWLVRLVPGVKTVLFPYIAADPSPRSSLPDLQKAAELLEITLRPVPVASFPALMRLLEEEPAQTSHAQAPHDGSGPGGGHILDGVEAVFVPADAVIASSIPELAAFAIRRRLPLCVPHRSGVVAGAVMSYGFDLAELGKQAARQADMILAGIAPGTIPIETAEFSLALNLKTAQAIGLTIPDAILRQARLVQP